MKNYLFTHVSRHCTINWTLYTGCAKEFLLVGINLGPTHAKYVLSSLSYLYNPQIMFSIKGTINATCAKLS